MIVSVIQSQENQLVSKQLPLVVLSRFYSRNNKVIQWWPGDECLKARKREGEWKKGRGEGEKETCSRLVLSLFAAMFQLPPDGSILPVRPPDGVFACVGGERKGNRFFSNEPIRLRAAARRRTVTHNKHALRHDGIISVVILRCRFFSLFYSSLRLNVFSFQVSLCWLLFLDHCHVCNPLSWIDVP